MASSRQFVWVTVNRDRTPDIPKQYAVSAYPTLLTVGPNNEKIHRFQSFQKPPEFLASLGISEAQVFLRGKSALYCLEDRK